MDVARIFSLSEKKEISICTTALVFSNAYYILRQQGTHKKVIEKVLCRYVTDGKFNLFVKAY